MPEERIGVVAQQGMEIEAHGRNPNGAPMRRPRRPVPRLAGDAIPQAGRAYSAGLEDRRTAGFRSASGGRAT